MNKFYYCKKCILPSTRPNISYNLKTELCSVCAQITKSKVEINWKKRKKEFERLIAKNKKKNYLYDCVIPVSGGKDSTWQVVNALKYKLKPLCVTWKTPSRSRIGSKNLQNLIDLGVSHIDFTINQKIEKKFILKSFIKYGEPLIPMHMAMHAIPTQIAVKFKVPLVLWAENPRNEYGSKKIIINEKYLTNQWRKLFGNTKSTTSRDWVDKEMTTKDMPPYIWLDEKTKKKNNVKEIFLGYFFKWDPLKIFNISKKNGFEPAAKPKTGIYNFADIDDEFLVTIHHWLKWYKFGFTRSWDNLSIEIRKGRITREKAIESIKKIGQEVPYKEINLFCKYLGISNKNFYRIIGKFRNKNIWHKEKNIWKIKNFLIKDWNWSQK